MESDPNFLSAALATTLDWIHQNPGLAYLIVFLVSMVESLAVIGVIVPGMVFLFSIGALVGSGTLDFFVLAFLGSLGAIVGDALSFYLGFHYHDRIHTHPALTNYQRYVKLGEVFFHRYGVASIVIGRFFGPIRAFVPLVAGMFQMNPKLFFLANVSSAIIWAPAVLIPGVIAGAALSLSYEHPYWLITSLSAFGLGSWLIFRGAKQGFQARMGLVLSGLGAFSITMAALVFSQTQSLSEITAIAHKVWEAILSKPSTQ